jgi:hypothetical protein
MILACFPPLWQGHFPQLQEDFPAVKSRNHNQMGFTCHGYLPARNTPESNLDMYCKATLRLFGSSGVLNDKYSLNNKRALHRLRSSYPTGYATFFL